MGKIKFLSLKSGFIMSRLNEKHLAKAREIVINNRIKQSCKYCYDRGYIGTNEENMLILCHKCVDKEKAYQDWKEYVSQYPELKEIYQDMFTKETKTD